MGVALARPDKCQMLSAPVRSPDRYLEVFNVQRQVPPHQGEVKHAPSQSPVGMPTCSRPVIHRHKAIIATTPNHYSAPLVFNGQTLQTLPA